MILAYLNYLFKAKTLHGTHSPFMYDFYERVFNRDLKKDNFEAIEVHRRALQQSKESIHFEDFGAGSVTSKRVSNRLISKIAKRSLKKPKWGRAFNRLVSEYQPNTIIELGTSLGITTAYLASANPNFRIHTFEGSKEVLKKAEGFFKELHLSNIETHLGNIDETLPKFLSTFNELGFVFIDANHKLEPTLRYFNLVFPFLTENSIVVFDDIYWSSEMKEAWSIIKKDNRVKQTVDLFEVGIVFFRNSQEKEHFVLKY